MLSSEKGTRPRVKGQGGGGAGTLWERNTSGEMPDRVVRNLLKWGWFGVSCGH